MSTTAEFKTATSSTGRLHVLNGDKTMCDRSDRRFATTGSEITIHAGSDLKQITCRACQRAAENMLTHGQPWKRMGSEESSKMYSRLVAAHIRNLRSCDLDSLRVLEELAKQVEAAKVEMVKCLVSKEGGAASWSQISEQLGISRQGAEQWAKRRGIQTANMPGGRASRFR